MEPYTVAVTSCGRFDLLERTLRSLLPRLDGPFAGILIAEDSGDERIYDVVRQFGDAYGKIDDRCHPQRPTFGAGIVGTKPGETEHGLVTGFARFDELARSLDPHRLLAPVQ